MRQARRGGHHHQRACITERRSRSRTRAGLRLEPEDGSDISGSETDVELEPEDRRLLRRLRRVLALLGHPPQQRTVRAVIYALHDWALVRRRVSDTQAEGVGAFDSRSLRGRR